MLLLMYLEVAVQSQFLFGFIVLMFVSRCGPNATLVQPVRIMQNVCLCFSIPFGELFLYRRLCSIIQLKQHDVQNVFYWPTVQNQEVRISTFLFCFQFTLLISEYQINTVFFSSTCTLYFDIYDHNRLHLVHSQLLYFTWGVWHLKHICNFFSSF